MKPFSLTKPFLAFASCISFFSGTFVAANCNVHACAEGAVGGITLRGLYWFFVELGAEVAEQGATAVWCTDAALSLTNPVTAVGGIGVDIVCLVSIAAPVLVGAGGAGCTSCGAVAYADYGDATAREQGCGISGGTGRPGMARLGPNKCMRLSTSVRNPRDGIDIPNNRAPSGIDYTFQCDHYAQVYDKTDTTTSWPCQWCDQCEKATNVQPVPTPTFTPTPGHPRVGEEGELGGELDRPEYEQEGQKFVWNDDVANEKFRRAVNIAMMPKETAF